MKDKACLTLAKNNLTLQKTAWKYRDSNYYLFDSESKTASQVQEMRLSFTTSKMEQMKGGLQEEDQFSFFIPDGLVSFDSSLAVKYEDKQKQID